MLRSAAVLACLFPLAISAQVADLGRARRVAAPTAVPAWAQLDSVVADHGGFIVFWSQLSGGATTNATLMARRVDNAGRQVAPDQEILPAMNRWAASVSRRSDGSLFLAWRTQDAIFIANAGADLVVRNGPTPLATNVYSQPVTACNATACVVIWNGSAATAATFVTSDGTRSSIALPICGYAYNLAVAATANTFAVVYDTADVKTSAHHNGLLVFDNDGNVLTNDGCDATDTYGAVAASANGYIAARLTSSGVRVTTKDARGADLATRDLTLPFAPSDVSITATAAEPLVIASKTVYPGVVIEGTVPRVRLFVANGTTTPIDEDLHADIEVQTAFNGTTVLAGWTSAGFNFFPEAAFYRVIDPAAPDADQPFPVATRPGPQTAAALARTDATELAVWSEQGLDTVSLKAAVRPAGSDALAEPILLQPQSISQWGGVAATDGHDFAVLWTWNDYTNTGVRAALIDSAGTITHRLDIDGLLDSNVTWFDGAYVFVTYANSSVRLNRLSRDGTITSTEIGKNSYGLRVAAANSADRLGVMYAPDPDLFFRVLDRSGSMIAERQLPPLRATCADVSAHDDQFLAAIRTYEQGRLFTYRFGSDAAMLDAVPLQLDTDLPTAIPPIVVENDNGWLVVWQRSDGSSRAVFISAAGGFSSAPFTVAAADAPVSAIAVSSDASMTMLSTKATGFPPAYRVVARDFSWHTQPKRRSLR